MKTMRSTARLFAIAGVAWAVAFGQGASSDPRSGVVISGRMVTQRLKPVENQLLKLQEKGRENTIAAQTDKTGAFVFIGVRANRTYDLSAEIAGQGSSVREVRVEQQNLNLGDVVLFTPIIMMRVVSYSGAPLGGETVTLSVAGKNRATERQIDERGWLFLPVIGKQHYSLRVAAPGHSASLMDIEMPDRDLELGTIVLQPLGLLPRATAAQPRAPQDKIATVRLSVRLSDGNGTPYSARVVGLQDMSTLFSQQGSTNLQAISSTLLTTDRTGRFVFPAMAHHTYSLFFTEVGSLASHNEIGTFVLGSSVDVHVDIITAPPSQQRQPGGRIIGPINLSSPGTGQVAGVYIGAGGVQIIQSDSSLFQAPAEKDQVGSSSPSISEDGSAVGWLVDSDFCCTSYPIQLILVVYRPGKPLSRFTGDGRAIINWRFAGGGRQVAIYQDFLHGTPGQHYELRELSTGRMLDKFDGEITRRAPAWVQPMK